MKQFAERLAEARKNRGMTQTEVAEALGVSFQAVSLWERGETNPDLEKLPEIARLLGVSTDWLLMERSPIPAAALEGLSDRLFNEDRMYTYVKTCAVMKGLEQTVRVLPYARMQHKGQVRKGKDHVPYIYHPLLMACHALALGLADDDVLSTVLLHDVCEDCGVAPEELPANERTRTAVALLTKSGHLDEAGERAYYEAISGNELAVIVKLLDRCCNVSDMAAGLSPEKMRKYIWEVEEFFYPMISRAKVCWPSHSDALFLIKYHMSSVVEAVRRLVI